jgi:hypothetical protein
MATGETPCRGEHAGLFHKRQEGAGSRSRTCSSGPAHEVPENTQTPEKEQVPPAAPAEESSAKGCRCASRGLRKLSAAHPGPSRRLPDFTVSSLTPPLGRQLLPAHVFPRHREAARLVHSWCSLLHYSFTGVLTGRWSIINDTTAREFISLGFQIRARSQRKPNRRSHEPGRRPASAFPRRKSAFSIV